ELPVVGKAADWGMGLSAVSKRTKQAGARIAGLKATESVCPYCAVGCGQLVQQPGRLTKVRYRPPGGTEWEELELEEAMDMIAERVIAAREHGWQERD